MHMLPEPAHAPLRAARRIQGKRRCVVDADALDQAFEKFAEYRVAEKQNEQALTAKEAAIKPVLDSLTNEKEAALKTLRAAQLVMEAVEKKERDFLQSASAMREITVDKEVLAKIRADMQAIKQSARESLVKHAPEPESPPVPVSDDKSSVSFSAYASREEAEEEAESSWDDTPLANLSVAAAGAGAAAPAPKKPAATKKRKQVPARRTSASAKQTDEQVETALRADLDKYSDGTQFTNDVRNHIGEHIVKFHVDKKKFNKILERVGCASVPSDPNKVTSKAIIVKLSSLESAVATAFEKDELAEKKERRRGRRPQAMSDMGWIVTPVPGSPGKVCFGCMYCTWRLTFDKDDAHAKRMACDKYRKHHIRDCAEHPTNKEKLFGTRIHPAAPDEDEDEEETDEEEEKTEEASPVLVSSDVTVAAATMASMNTFSAQATTSSSGSSMLAPAQ